MVTRLVAAVIDAVVVALALLAGYLGLCGLLFLVSPRDFSFPDLRPVFSLTCGFLATVGYLTVAWRISGRSYGSLVMGLRVVGRRGRGCAWAGRCCARCCARCSRSACSGRR